MSLQTRYGCVSVMRKSYVLVKSSAMRLPHSEMSMSPEAFVVCFPLSDALDLEPKLVGDAFTVQIPLQAR